MRKRNIVLITVVLIFGGCQFGDELIAYSAGTPVRLVSSTGSMAGGDGEKLPLLTFTHAFMESGDIRLVGRTFFHGSGPLTRPYLTADDEGHGVIHIDTKAQLGFLRKCEFLRQFEIEIRAADLKGLRSLQVFNHDVDEWASEAIQLSDPNYMAALLQKSKEQLALQDPSGVPVGC